MTMLTTIDGCRLIIAKHGARCWRYQPLCYDFRKKRWVFKSPRLLHICCIAHFDYCTRSDKTRNIVVDGSECVNTYPICCGSKDKCAEELYKKLVEIAEGACHSAEENCLQRCFGLYAEEFGMFLSMHEIEYCC